jgi:CO/xanthine dehydrogenase FAD-binding subunit
MKAQVVTTITSLVDIETFETSHSVDINDQDGLSEVSREVMGALLIGALRSTETAVRRQFPQQEDRPASPITDDEKGE